MIRVTDAQLGVFESIWNHFGHGIKRPKRRNWRDLSHNDVWIRIMSQVVVVGSAKPAKRLWDKSIRSRVEWQRLRRMDEMEAAETIWGVLKEIGARYVGRTQDACPKTKALLQNRVVLMKYPGGPQGFIKDVTHLPGSSRKKVEYVSQRLSYIKNKGARDLLTTGFGLVKNHIAFDVRVLGSLRHIGLRFPSNVASQTSLYDEFERILIQEVCRPLKITGAQLDQLLFLHYKDIKEMTFRNGKIDRTSTD
jgi:hypothetical protein